MQTSKRRKRIADRLGEIAAAHDGRLTAEEVVDDATDPQSPLHEEFQWDDTKAAHQFRLDQARQIIREVRVIVKVKSVSVPVIAYVRDPSSATDEQGYVAVPHLRTDADLAREALQYEIQRAMAALERARDVALALGLIAEIDDMRETLIALRGRLAEAA